MWFNLLKLDLASISTQIQQIPQIQGDTEGKNVNIEESKKCREKLLNFVEKLEGLANRHKDVFFDGSTKSNIQEIPELIVCKFVEIIDGKFDSMTSFSEHPVEREPLPQLDAEQVGQPDRVTENGARLAALTGRHSLTFPRLGDEYADSAFSRCSPGRHAPGRSRRAGRARRATSSSRRTRRCSASRPCRGRPWRWRARMVCSLPLAAHNRSLPSRGPWVVSSLAQSAFLQC